MRIPDFESSASANSATPASGFERNVYRSIALVKRDAPLFFSLPSLPSLLFFFSSLSSLSLLSSLFFFFLFSFRHSRFSRHFFLFVTLVSLVTFFLFVTLVSLVTFSFRCSHHSRFSRHFFFSSLSLLFSFRCSRYLLSLFLPDGEGAVGTGAPSLRYGAQGSWATPRFAAWRGASGQRLASLRGAGLQGNASPRFAAWRRAFRTLSKWRPLISRVHQFPGMSR